MVRAAGVLVLLVAGGCRLGFEVRTESDASTAGDSPGAATDSGAPSANCKTSYTFLYGTSKYRGGGSDTWTSFEADCESDGVGMHLAVIDSAAELAGLAPLAANTPTWIGISDLVTEGTFVSVTGASPAVLPWAIGHPTANGPDCVLWDPATNTFTDEACGNPHPRICECDGVPADQAAY